MKSLQSKVIATSFLMMLVIPPAYATKAANRVSQSFQPYVSLASGVSLASIKSSTTGQITSGGVTSSYSFIGKSNTKNLFYNVGTGVRMQTHNMRWFSAVDLGVSYGDSGTLTASGTHNVKAAPVINNANYHYKYHLDLSAFSLNVDTCLYSWKKASLFIGAGVDFASVTNSDFSQTPINGAPGLEFTMDKHTDHVTLYHLSAGLIMPVSKHLLMGMTYRYYPTFHFTTGQFNTGVVTQPGLRQSVSINQVGAHLIYMF